jgi:recombination protein RecR
VRRDRVREVILATDPDAEGEATARLVLEALTTAGLAVRVTRMARGLPAGSAIEYLHKGVLEDALEGRVELKLAPRRGPRT